MQRNAIFLFFYALYQAHSEIILQLSKAWDLQRTQQYKKNNSPIHFPHLLTYIFTNVSLKEFTYVSGFHYKQCQKILSSQCFLSLMNSKTTFALSLLFPIPGKNVYFCSHMYKPISSSLLIYSCFIKNNAAFYRNLICKLIDSWPDLEINDLNHNSVNLIGS